MQRGCVLNATKTIIMPTCSGTSVIPRIRQEDPALADEIETTIATYSTGEETRGACLLGEPIGSGAFAIDFLNAKADEVQEKIAQLNANVSDLHTRLRLFSQCFIAKLPHLLGAEVMHTCPLDINAANWKGWIGPIIHRTDRVNLHGLLRQPPEPTRPPPPCPI